MRCPSCGADVTVSEAVFCPHCGTPLGAQEAAVTADLSHPSRPVVEASEATMEPSTSDQIGETEVSGTPEEGAATATISLSDRGVEPEPSAREGGGAGDFLVDFFSSLRRSLSRGGWLQASGAAAFGLLTLIALGAVLVIAGKLQYPELGSGSGALAVLSALVMTALAILRVPLHIGALEVSALPLGALALFGLTFIWAVARSLRAQGVTDLRDAVGRGVRSAVPFALFCLVAALVFRIRTDPSPVSADALSALVLGLVWAALFGMIGGALAIAPFRVHVRGALELLKGRSREAYEGVLAGGVMLAIALMFAAMGALVWIIVGLLRGGPGADFGLGTAAAAAIYLLAFGPNVIASILAVALGASVDIGAQVTVNGRLVGSMSELSLQTWGNGNPPWYAFLLLLVPAVACLLGGFFLRRKAESEASLPMSLIFTALTFALVLFELAALSEARLGAGLIRERGIGRIAPDPWMVLLLAFLWALLFGFVGWRIAGASDGDASTTPEPQATPFS